MAGLYSKFIKPLHFIGDIVIINISFLASYYFVFGTLKTFFLQNYFGLILYFNIAWLAIAYFLSVYKLYRVTSFIGILLKLIRSLLLYFLLIVAFNGMTYLLSYSRYQILLSFAFIAVGMTLWRLTVYVLLRVYRKRGYNFRKVVIAGFSDAAHDLHDFFISHPEHGYKFMGVFDDDVSNHPDLRGTLSDMEKFVLDNDVDEIYCIMSRLGNEQVNQIMNFSDNNFIRVKLVPGLMEFPYKNFKLDLYDYLPVIAVRTIPLDDGINKFIKRAFDVLFSLLVCVLLLSWLLPFFFLLIKLDSKGPVFFRQKRSGLNNREFLCWKLRSMYVNDEAHTKQAAPGDERITHVGKFLRKYNIDELPQFFNVFIGNMSVVGPRPHMLKHTEEYSQVIEKYMLRHFIKPGITGLSQSVGLRGETQDPALMRRRVKTDLFYIENWSFLLDLRIIIITILNFFRGNKNAV